MEVNIGVLLEATCFEDAHWVTPFDLSGFDLHLSSHTWQNCLWSQSMQASFLNTSVDKSLVTWSYSKEFSSIASHVSKNDANNFDASHHSSFHEISHKIQKINISVNMQSSNLVSGINHLWCAVVTDKSGLHSAVDISLSGLQYSSDNLW